MRPPQPPNKLHGLKFSFGLYVLVSFLAFFPCLIGGRAYFDNDLLAQFGPWRIFLKDQLSHWHFPLWNPYNLGGMPFFADLQNMMAYPPNYLTLPFSVPYGLSVFFFLHMAWAAAGTHLWLRSLGLSQNACRLGALLFACSGFFWLEIIHPPVLAAFAWLPWLFWSLEKLSRTLRARDAFLAGLAFAMLFLCGSFQVTLGGFYSGLAYFLFRFFFNASGKKQKTGPLGVAFLLLIWGALPLLCQLVPTLELSFLSDRHLSPKTAGQLDPGLSLAPPTLYQLFFPRLTLPLDQTLAEAIQGKEGSNAASNYLANLGYLGPWIPFLAFWAFRRKEKNLVYFFSFLSLFVLAVCCGRFLPFHGILFRLLPGFSTILVPYRFLYLFTLGAVLVASLGFERWVSSLPARPLGFNRLAGTLLFAFSAGALGLSRPLQNWREILGLGLGLAGILISSLTPGQRRRGVLLFQAGVILPLLLNGWACFPTGPASNFNFTENSKSIAGIGAKASPYRILFDSPGLKYPIEVQGKKYLVNYPQNAACALGIKNFGGYNPLVLKAKMELGTLGLAPLARMGALQGILTQENHGNIPGFTLESYPPYMFYANRQTPSYAFAPGTSKTFPDSSAELGAMRNPDFDPAQEIFFSASPSEVPTGISDGADLRCVLEKDGVDGQDFRVEVAKDHWVVFTEMMYPGWKARVDGTPAPIVTADFAFRALYLKAGPHRVEFRFEPDWAGPLRVGLILWILVTLGFWFHGGPLRKTKIA